jgi:hypothetical protein
VKAVAARSKKSNSEGVSLETNKNNTRFDNIYELVFTPSLVKGEDPAVHAKIHAQVVKVVQPKDVWDQKKALSRLSQLCQLPI